ncbi:MAG: Eco57I restriction-modification methylase domain-containing protein [Pseudomonadota bacterium]
MKKAELIGDTIFCVDVDPQAVEITRMWLYILMLEEEASPIVTGERRYKIPNRIFPPRIEAFQLPSLAGNVINGNSLVGPDFSDNPEQRAAAKVFDWKSGDHALSKAVQQGGFDVIAGNPPYLRYSDAVKHIPQQAAYLRATYRSMSARQADLSYAFIEKGLDLLKPTGRLGYITSNIFIWTGAGAALRQVIADSRSLRELTDLGIANVFEDARPATAVVILDGKPRRYFKHARVLVEDLVDDTVLSAFPSVKHTQFPSSRLAARNWTFPAPSDAAAFERISRHGIRLDEIANGFSGVTSGADPIFLVERLRNEGRKALVRSKQSQDPFWIESNLLRPVFRGRHIYRYKPMVPSEWLIVPHEKDGAPLSLDVLARRFPLGFDYLSQHKSKLQSRPEFAPPNQTWYALHRIRDPRLMNGPKLVTGWRKGAAQFTLDSKGHLFQSVGCGVSLTDKRFDLPMLLGLLNSRPVYAYARTMKPELWSGIVFASTLVESIPIVAMTGKSRPLYAAIGARAQRILDLETRADADPTAAEEAQKLQDEIDDIVLALYALDPDTL